MITRRLFVAGTMTAALIRTSAYAAETVRIVKASLETGKAPNAVN